jgi:predicted amidophosphoribosyltransferase
MDSQLSLMLAVVGVSFVWLVTSRLRRRSARPPTAGSPRCPHCGGALPESASQCPHCGASVNP